MSILGRFFHRDGMSDYRHGIILFNQGRYAEAVAAFERTLEAIANPADPYYSLGRFYAAEAHAKLGLARHGSGDADGAEREFRRAIGCGYRYPDLHVTLASILEARGDYQGSERECRSALEIHPAYLDARCRLAIALILQERTEEARAVFSSLAADGCALPAGFDPDRSPLDSRLADFLREAIAERQRGHLHLTRALESYDRGHRDQAIAELRAAVQTHPRYADLRCRLGSLLLEEGRLEDGMAELEFALEINPEYVEARLQAGVACLRIGDPAAAVRHLEAAHRRQPDYPDVQLFLGIAHLRDGEPDKATAVLEKTLAQFPTFHRARYALGLVRLAGGRTEEGMRLIDEANRGDPSMIRGRIDLGFIGIRHGEPEVAARLFRQVLDQDPTDEEAHLGFGLALEATGDLTHAQRELEEAIRLEPGIGPALAALARIDLKMGRPREALVSITGALEIAPGDPDLHCLEGEAYARLGDATKAKEAYEAVLAAQPNRTEARVGLGLALFNLGRKDAGRAEMEAAFRTDPANPIARVFADEGLIAGL